MIGLLDIGEPELIRAWSEEVQAALEPRVAAEPIEWVGENVLFPAVASSSPTLYDFSMYPWVRGLFEAVSDPTIAYITLMFATQLGKTAFLIALLAYLAVNNPSPVLMAGPNQDLCKSVSTNKIYPILRASPETLRLLPPEHRQKDLEVDLLWSRIYFGWSGSPATLGDRSCKYILKFELDKWSYDATREADPSELCEERKKDFVDWLVIQESTPTEEGTSRIDAAYQSSDRRTFRVPCPHCGTYQAIEWEQLQLPRGPDGRLAPPHVCQREAHYPCRECERDLEERHKPAMMRRGVWARAGEGVERDGRVFAEKPDEIRIGNHAGFQLSSLYSLKISWGEIGAKWSAAQQDAGKLQNFVNSWLGRPFAPRARVTTERQVLYHRGIEEGLTYQRDTCPLLPLACLLIVDVQEDCLWYTVWAWCRDKRQYLLRHGQLPADLESCLSLAALTYRTTGGQTFGHTYCLMDSGYGGRTEEVYRFCVQHGFIPTKGFDSENRVQPIKWTKLENGLNLLGITVLHFKDHLARMIESTELNAPGCWRLPETVDLDFARQLTAEKRILKRHALTGKPRHIWVRTRPDNHYWDCSVISLAAALALEWEGLDFYKRPAEPRPVKPGARKKQRPRPYSSGELVARLGRPITKERN